MTVLEDWPSLPPICTSSSCGRDSRVSCETLSLYDPAPPSASFSPSSDVPLSSRKFDPFFQPPTSTDASPLSTATSAIGFFSSSSGHLFSCFPNKSASHALSKSMMSPREGKRGAPDVGGVLRSLVGFSGSIQHSGPIAHSGAIAHSSKLGSGATSGHSGGLKGYSVSSKGHAANAFTMMPPDVVGKKKPPGYESDEPTSPEVTCIGRVRRKKHCKAWDALVKEKKCGDMKGKGKKPGFESPRKLNYVPSPRTEKQFESPRKAMVSRWKQVLHGNETESHDADLHKQSNVKDLNSDQGRFSLASGISDVCLFPSLNSKQLPSEGKNSDVADEGAEVPSQHPPPNCLLMMRNTAHSREHLAYEESSGAASESASSMAKHGGSKPSNDTSLWKRRMTRPEPLELALKEKQ